MTDLDRTAQIFGIDVRDLAPGASAAIEGDVLGYPVTSLAALPAGPVRAQAVLHRYETFRRSDGRVLELPPDLGKGSSGHSRRETRPRRRFASSSIRGPAAR